MSRVPKPPGVFKWSARTGRHLLGSVWRRVAWTAARVSLHPRLGRGPDWAVECLREGWGNKEWAAPLPLLMAIRDGVDQTSGVILDCGSGASTILAALLTRGTHRRVVALEHDRVWATTTGRRLRQLGCDHAKVVHAPLRDFGDYAWYDISGVTLPGRVDLVIVDGPPGATKGGRRGLLYVVGPSLQPGTLFILDDSQREGEQAVIDDWIGRFDLRVEETRAEGRVTLLRRGETST